MRFDLLHILFHVNVMFYFLSSSFKSTECHMNAVLRVYSYYHRVPRQHFRDMNILKKKKFPDPCNWFLPVNMAKFAPTSFAMFNLFIAPSVPPYYYNHSIELGRTLYHLLYGGKTLYKSFHNCERLVEFQAILGSVHSSLSIFFCSDIHPILLLNS